MSDYEIIRPRRDTWWERFKRSITLGPYNPRDRELARIFGGGGSSAGVRVDEETSLSYAAVWNAVCLISGDVAKVPLQFFRAVGDGGKEPYRNHPLYELLHDQPNDEMSAFNFRRAIQGHALVWGNGYAEIERNGAGQPIALWPILPWAVQPIRERGRLMYRINQPSGGEIVLDRMDVLHLSGFGLDGTNAYPPIRKAMESIGLGIATQRFAAKFYENGAQFGGIINAKGITNPQSQKDFRENIQNYHGGVDKSHRFLVLYGDMDYQSLGIEPDKAQFLETRRFNVEEVARWFNIPVHKLKELERSTNNNIEHQGIEYYTDTLQPWYRAWEGELRLKLIPRLERKIQFFEHNTEALTRGDSAAQGALISQQFMVGAIKPNEVRGKFNMNPVPDGDDIYVPSNTMPARLAIQYWEAQIDESKAKAEASRRPPEPPPAPNADEMNSLREQIVKLEAEILTLRSIVQGKEDQIELAKHNAELEKERAELVTAALETNKDLAARHAEALSGSIALLTQERDEARAAVTLAEAAKQAAEAALVWAKEAHEAERGQWTQNNSDQLAAYAEARSTIDAISQRISETEQARNTAVDDVHGLAIECEALDETLTREREMDVFAVNERIAELEKQHGALSAEAEVLKFDLARMEQERDAARTEYATCMQNLRTVEEADADVRNQLALLSAERSEISAEIARCVAEAETLKADVARIEQERDAEKERADRAGTEAAQIKEALESAEVAGAELFEKTSALERVVGDLNARVEHLGLDADGVSAELAAEKEKFRTFKLTQLAAMRSLWVEANERLLAKESTAVRKHQQTPEKLRAWIENFYELHANRAREVFQPLVGPWTALTGGAPGMLLDRLVHEHINTSRTALRLVADADDPDQMAAQLERTLSRWEHERADAMADALVREGMSNG